MCSSGACQHSDQLRLPKLAQHSETLASQTMICTNVRWPSPRTNGARTLKRKEVFAHKRKSRSWKRLNKRTDTSDQRGIREKRTIKTFHDRPRKVPFLKTLLVSFIVSNGSERAFAAQLVDCVMHYTTLRCYVLLSCRLRLQAAS